MTQIVEFDLAKVLESIDQKLNRVLEAQIRLEGEVKTLQVEVTNIKEDVREIKTELKETKEELSSEIKEVRTELKETKNEVSGLYKWVIGLIITAGVGFGTIIFRVFDLFPKA